MAEHLVVPRGMQQWGWERPLSTPSPFVAGYRSGVCPMTHPANMTTHRDCLLAGSQLLAVAGTGLVLCRVAMATGVAEREDRDAELALHPRQQPEVTRTLQGKKDEAARIRSSINDSSLNSDAL